jgi:hypothetical protein
LTGLARGDTIEAKDDTAAGATMAEHERTLAAIFARPTRANIKWSDIESLFVSLGAVVEEGDGSRVHFDLNGFGATFHRPHPQKETRR